MFSLLVFQSIILHNTKRSISEIMVKIRYKNLITFSNDVIYNIVVCKFRELTLPVNLKLVLKSTSKKLSIFS